MVPFWRHITNETVLDMMTGITACINDNSVKINLVHHDGIAWTSMKNLGGTYVPNGSATTFLRPKSFTPRVLLTI